MLSMEMIMMMMMMMVTIIIITLHIYQQPLLVLSPPFPCLPQATPFVFSLSLQPGGHGATMIFMM